MMRKKVEELEIVLTIVPYFFLWTSLINKQILLSSLGLNPLQDVIDFNANKDAFSFRIICAAK